MISYTVGVTLHCDPKLMCFTKQHDIVACIIIAIKQKSQSILNIYFIQLRSPANHLVANKKNVYVLRCEGSLASQVINWHGDNKAQECQ